MAGQDIPDSLSRDAARLRKGEVRKRSEIAACADGAAAGHLRQHVAVQAREDRFHKPAIAFASGVGRRPMIRAAPVGR